MGEIWRHKSHGMRRRRQWRRRRRRGRRRDCIACGTWRAATTEPVAFRAEVIAAAPSFCQLESARGVAIDEHLSPPSAIGDLEKVADDGSGIWAGEGFKEGGRGRRGTMTSDRQAAHEHADGLSTWLNILHSYRRSRLPPPPPSLLLRGIPDEYVNMNERASDDVDCTLGCLSRKMPPPPPPPLLPSPSPSIRPSGQSILLGLPSFPWFDPAIVLILVPLIPFQH